MVKSNRQYNFFIVMMGPGEISQGMAFAIYAKERGVLVTLSVTHKNYLPLVSTKKLSSSNILVTSNAKELRSALRKNKPDLLVLCNSKIFTRDDDFAFTPPKPKVPNLSIDSNWLFFPKSPYRYSPWIDRYCLNFPEAIFKLGLKSYGGHYFISKDVQKKISVVGMVPSYRPISKLAKKKIRSQLGIKRDEKLVFLYASMGYLFKSVVFTSAVKTIRALNVKGYKIKVVYFGDEPGAELERTDYKWFITKKRPNISYFYQVLASSDLVFQHQGLATLEQSICAKVPVVAMVCNKKNEKFPRYHRHAWEVSPFARFGACAMLYFNTLESKIKKTVESLLYNNKVREKMITKQHLLYSVGEKKIYKEALKLLKKRGHL